LSRDESWQEALTRSRAHFRRAAAEAVAGLRALLDAAALGLGPAGVADQGALAVLARGLDELSAALAPEGGDPSRAVLDTLLDAVDAEIERWEARSAGDEEARMVLRTFLSVREVLWELGVRREGDTGAPGRRAPAAHRRPEGPRVQRVEVER